MADQEQPLMPIWAEAKSKKQIDVLKEASKVIKSIEDADRVRGNQPIGDMTERELEAEQFRLGYLLHEGTLTVDGFRRLREIDFYLESMRQRRHHGPAQEEWTQERLSDD